MAHILICPDSFKGGPDAATAGAAIAAGWQRWRPHDEVDLCPLADGGEGTAAVIAGAVPGSEWVPVKNCPGPDGLLREGFWLRLADGTAVVDLAGVSGLPLLAAPAPMTATTAGLGVVLAAAVNAGSRRLVIGLGGSASTDGGAGALAALGLELLDGNADRLRSGAGLLEVAHVRREGLLAPPPDGVEVLVDVRAPLHGPRGAASVFAPQKGATAAQVEELDCGLRHWADLLGGDPDLPGAGAAGGTGFGLAAGWGARLSPGAATVADLVGLDERLTWADLVITGEGRYDATSHDGKVVGEVLHRAERAGTRARVVAGVTDASGQRSGRVLTLAGLAGSAEESLRRPESWLTVAGKALARHWPVRQAS